MQAFSTNAPEFHSYFLLKMQFGSDGYYETCKDCES